MEKLFETKKGSILYYDGASRKLIAKNSECVADILASLKKDANSIDPVDRIFAEGFLADIEKLGITTQEF